MKTIRQRVEESFSDDDSRNFIEAYLGEVLTGMRDTQTQFRRGVLLLVLAITLFELLARASVREVSLALSS
jgi:hypothetical protein